MYQEFYELGFLRWLEQLRTPAITQIMLLFTKFGEEIFFTIVAMILLWCVNKRHGYYILSVCFFGTVINQMLKIVCHVPRPWVKDASFTVVPEAQPGAAGYSFPSGHTQNVVGTMGGIVRISKNRWFHWLCVAIAAICAFSRMYLGCHTLLDVGTSAIIAVILVFVVQLFFHDADENPNRMYCLFGIFSVMSIAYLLFLHYYQFPAEVTKDAIHESASNAFSLFGGTIGMLLAYTIDRRYIQYDEHAVWWVQIIKVVVGLLLVLAIKSGLKPLLSAVLGNYPINNFIRYLVLFLFAGAGWPSTFRFFAKLGK